MTSWRYNNEPDSREQTHNENEAANLQTPCSVERFAAAVAEFAASVDKLQTILGMQAENDQRKAHGLSMAYTEDAFASV